MRLAYLTSQYPATSHTFIRREVSALRAAGQTVETFSIRSPADSELVAPQDRTEAETTFTLLARPLRDFASAHLRALVANPASYVSTLFLAFRHRAPGLKSALLALAHFGESILLSAELKRRGISHLHNHFANSAATVGFMASQHAKISWSFTIHGISEFDYPAGLLLPQKIAAARFVACVSYFGRAQAMRLVDPAEWSKLHIVRCGVEADRLPQPTQDTDADLRLIYVGRLSPEKGVAGLLGALAAAQSRSMWRLTLVGDGPLRSDLEALATSLGLTENVRFLGRLPEEETLLQIANHDALALPSFMEGLPIVLMEAMALGRPVIASRVAGIPELVEDQESGLLFDPSNWPQLASALDRLAFDPTLLRQLGEQGPKRIAGEFDVRSSADQLISLFATVGRTAAIPKEPPGQQSQGITATSTERTTAT